ncbi:aconitate hydratase AcnA [Alkalilimnicola sp. S0819]|uniref:aconitate hydratase AcnA n=1 Tax=Alkalilimnicola sp. S0819 TaxID=2613922 RepID=UPI00126148DB|nr:aconitate hydratase AcnA [Alkalilimnicola sp. S0819]KAB7627506.1 aconitate hydratase AcnA [Alkalilimnicola sp. S0819]MPQ15660.1 aconitate hydratase AcnA [Alkalilimnicola sp. S0819]
MTDSYNARSTLQVNGKDYEIFRFDGLKEKYDIDRLPYSLKVLLENLLRFEDGENVTQAHIDALAQWDAKAAPDTEIAYTPARVVLQDFTGVPAVVDLAAMRDAMTKLGGNPQKINPLSPADLVIDHSVMVDYFGTPDALKKNSDIEFQRNQERYTFLRWGQKAFDNFRVVPPDTGIVHQVNIEYLADVVFTRKTDDGKLQAYPDTLVGTDSHTTMVNGLGVLGWGVGGIEAEAAMLGQPISMLIPQVVGFRLTGKLAEGATATDLVLTVTQMLRAKGVVGKFVEFFGDGLDHLPLADRATIANMAPEYGATCGIFPVDQETLNYLELTGRDQETIDLVEAYAKANGMWREAGAPQADYSDVLELDMGTVQPSLAGPKRPQDRVTLGDTAAAFRKALDARLEETGHSAGATRGVEYTENGETHTLEDGAVVIAAITSCTNTSNPAVLLAAGLVAKKADELGMQVKPWVKTSLAPGSQVVPAYLNKAGLTPHLNNLGFDVVGFGCTTCIGNAGPLPEAIGEAIKEGDLVVGSVLSGNRNFEGRIHGDVRTNWLASPPLVVAYALAGNMQIDLTKEPLGQDRNGNDVFLKDIWPSQKEVAEAMAGNVTREMFQQSYADVFAGDANWQGLQVTESEMYDWPESTYVKNPPYFDGMTMEEPGLPAVEGARCLVYVGDSITTDHISPASAIKADTPAGQYLMDNGVEPKDFNSYGSRRGNHEVMMRGTFANVRLRNKMAPGTEGGYTTYQPDGEQMFIFDAAMKYKEAGVPLVVLAGKEYGTGSSRDWAAKGTNLLGVKVVIAESFERIHRSNLVGMGVVPLQFKDGDSAEGLGLTGKETFSFGSLDGKPKSVTVTARAEDGSEKSFEATVRIDTPKEWDYVRNGGILHYVLRDLAKKAA